MPLHYCHSQRFQSTTLLAILVHYKTIGNNIFCRKIFHIFHFLSLRLWSVYNVVVLPVWFWLALYFWGKGIVVFYKYKLSPKLPKHQRHSFDVRSNLQTGTICIDISNYNPQYRFWRHKDCPSHVGVTKCTETAFGFSPAHIDTLIPISMATSHSPCLSILYLWIQAYSYIFRLYHSLCWPIPLHSSYRDCTLWFCTKNMTLMTDVKQMYVTSAFITVHFPLKLP